MSFRRKRKDVGADGDRAHVVALLVAVLVDSRVDDLLDAAGQRGHLGGIQAGGRRRDHGSLTPLLVLALERCGDPVHELLVPAVQRLGHYDLHGCTARRGARGVRIGELHAYDRSFPPALACRPALVRSDETTSELQSLMRISYASFCLKTKT